MPVELEQIKEGSYFKYSGAVIRIQEIHIPFLHVMRHDLVPILLENNELYMLGFSSVRDSKFGEFEKYTANGQRRLWLKKNPTDRGWNIVIGEADTKVAIQYVHELQEIWLVLFREPLRRAGDEPLPPLKLTYRLMPDMEVSVVTEEETRKGRSYGKMQRYNERLPYPEQLYYLVWDCCYLFRNIRYAIWKVTHPKDPKDVLFAYAGINWGLFLVAGKDTTESDTRAAGRWLQEHLRQNDLKNG
ncbi:hypothetical protein HF324_18370 [Chitinophaga oryzae]|uniref:Uncharacterized protein n=1 Tax=Chitinophaga oryzae TaxID=2725414 RepID=A0ABX6LHW6_9BACT|nr:hypothetical protein [Chitinophaga oryzae]QJB39714.1 hypothetical protein HF324_18370 [Chitinophaga oryzae]